ncbi:hypothetical protein HUA78_03570 [Myxococcus sp. CA033]|uniref:hypothetical protein n=1 Tax=Myxococcus sp. CA033 TaxID=2741516 RepID=UPI00157B0AF4|nr:hypothetical protein [Myxococcus sp. CA033]NTX33507.1 hypothetical protein [Myxococcus sp. CA033]
MGQGTGGTGHAPGTSASPSTTAQGTGGSSNSGVTPATGTKGNASTGNTTAPGTGGNPGTGATTAQGTGGDPSPASTTPPATAPGAGSPAPTASASGPCARDETFRITTVGKGTRPALQVEPDPGHGKALRAAEVDLDGRGQQDLYVVFPTDAGSDGATVQALYVHCSGDRYAPVWGPEYTLELKPLDTRTQGWRDVVHREKGGTLDAPTTKRVTMRFQGDTYQDASTETEKP